MALWGLDSGQQYSLGCPALCQGKAHSSFDKKQIKSLQLWTAHSESFPPILSWCSPSFPPLLQGQAFLFASTISLLPLTAP